jgi:hypothetical protein
VCVVALGALLGAGCQRGTVTPVGVVLLEKDTSAFLTGEARERAGRVAPVAHPIEICALASRSQAR